MTGPMVTPDRETLAKAVRDAVIKWNTFGTGKTSSDVSTHVADALIASGAVTTAADAVWAWAEKAISDLPALTEGPLRVGTALWPECDRDAYSLAIEEAQAALREALGGES